MAVPLDVAVGLLWQCSIPATARFFGSALRFSWSDLGVMWIRVHVIGAIGSMAVSKTVDVGSIPTAPGIAEKSEKTISFLAFSCFIHE